MRIVQFPLAASTEMCAACRQPTAGHVVRGRWVGCQRDVTVGQDQMTLARRLRLARLQSRVARVRPFGIDVDGMAAR